MHDKNKMLPIIAAFKIFKAATLFILAYGIHDLGKGDTVNTLGKWIREIHIDPEDKYAQQLIAKVSGISVHHLHELGIFTFAYATLFATEGVGLALKKRWAEYLTVVSTIGFLPIEIYEIVDTPHHKWMKAVLLVVNLAILVYLIWNLRRSKPDQTLAAPLAAQ